ncbi:MAG: FAD-binding oxidoreductase [Pseudomonadota bacterium]
MARSDTGQLRRLYNDHAFDTARDVASYWQATAPDQAAFPALSTDKDVDVLVIGAGFAGLNAALTLARDHDVSAVVLDAGQPGWAASGRNGGFCGLGSAMASKDRLVRQHGKGALEDFVDAQAQAVRYVAHLGDDAGLDLNRVEDGEFCMAHRPSEMTDLRAMADHYSRLLGQPSDVYEKESLRQAGIDGPGFHGAVRIPVGFGLHPLRYVRSLAKAVIAAGASIYGDSPVHSVAQRPDGRFAIETPNCSVTADRLIIATNGYSSEDVPKWLRGRYLPLVSHIILTEPIPQDLIAQQGWTTHQVAFDSRIMLHYFRLLPDGRFLFGMRGPTELTPTTEAAMQAEIRQHFDHMFPVWAKIPTAYHWSGLICVTYDMKPYIGPIGDWNNAWLALGWHGSGVAMASYAGKMIAGLSMGKDVSVPEIMTGPLRRFPIPGLRKSYLPFAFRYFDWLDRRST